MPVTGACRGQGGARNSGGLLDGNLLSQRSRHFLPGRRDAHIADRHPFQPTPCRRALQGARLGDSECYAAVLL